MKRKNTASRFEEQVENDQNKQFKNAIYNSL